MPEKDQKQRSKYWLLVLNQLKEKGVEDILIISTDNLPCLYNSIQFFLNSYLYFIKIPSLLLCPVKKVHINIRI